MTVLGNTALRRALDVGNLIVDPKPKIAPGTEGSFFDEATITLTLGDKIYRPKPGVQTTLDFSQPGSVTATLDAVLEPHPITEDGIQLKAATNTDAMPGGDFVIASVAEKVGFPWVDGEPQLMGRIEGRSKYARTGLLVHATAPTLQPQWVGYITFELKNLGYFTITLKRGSPIGQLVVEMVDGDVVKLPGEFDEQVDAIGSR